VVDLDVPDAVARAARALGGENLDWLNTLPDRLAMVAAAWGLRLGRARHGGSGAYVVEAVTPEGQAAILKLHMIGHEPFGQEVAVLGAAAGRGYASLLAHDPDLAATLLERLGKPLSRLNLSADDQMALICATLKETWVQVPVDLGLMTGAGKAELLANMISEMWVEQGEPCSPAVIDQALVFCGTRAAAYHPDNAVLVHGDAHPGNTLQSLSEPGQFKFVDPDGLLAEPACDLAVAMRDWSEELLEGDVSALAQTRAQHLADLTGVSAQAIWEWGFMERVSTGLYATKLGRPELGGPMLRVAERLVMDRD
jgi:streptomycin 6-kinase